MLRTPSRRVERACRAVGSPVGASVDAAVVGDELVDSFEMLARKGHMGETRCKNVSDVRWVTQ